MKFGCCVSIKNIKKAKELGYDFVELSGKEISSVDEKKWNDVLEEIKGAGIKVIGFNSFCDEKTPIVGNVDKDKLFSYSKKLVERGYQLDIDNIGIGAPKARMLEDGFSKELADNQLKEFLVYITSIGKQFNINILLEALNPHKCNYVTKTKEAYEIIQSLNIDNLYMVYDVYHSINSNEKYEDIASYFNKIKHVHISSWNKKDLSRYFILGKDKQYTKDLLVFLKDNNYDLSISIEAPDNNFDEVGKTSIGILKEAYSN